MSAAAADNGTRRVRSSAVIAKDGLVLYCGGAHRWSSELYAEAGEASRVRSVPDNRPYHNFALYLRPFREKLANKKRMLVIMPDYNN